MEVLIKEVRQEENKSSGYAGFDSKKVKLDADIFYIVLY